MKKEQNVSLQEPLVSICLITYNHEKYIKQAVDSILAQHMDFPYEVLIADDASTDNTQKILTENYSDIEHVKLILWSKNNQGKNAYLAIQEAKGKYIYYCEGDDYWIGEDGLQTLVDWLEAHRDYIGVCGRRITLSEKTGIFNVSYDKRTSNQVIQLNDILENEIVFDMCATLHRNFYHDDMCDYRSYLACRTVGDLTNMLYILLHGNVFQLDKLVGVYRADRIKGASSYNSLSSPKKVFEDHMELISNLPNLIHVKLNYSKLKKRYGMWYANSCVSVYEMIKQIPYMKKKVGIRITLSCVKDRIKAIRS